jgi:aspartate aminotransferase
MKVVRVDIADRVRGIEISGIRKMFEAAGPDAINLGLGQPDFDTPAHIKAAAIRAIDEGKTGYTVNMGIPELRTAICDKLGRENGLSYKPDQVLVTAGASEALHIVMQALVNPGDRVLLADPGFVSYGALATLAGGIPVGVGLDERMRINIEEAKEKMDDARLFVLNSPANPTGAVEPADHVRAIVEYASDAGVTVVSDEVYEHFIYGAEHVSAARFGDNVITVNGASKTYAMTGWRVGFLAGPREYTEECLKVHQYCQACATSISQYAALAAYTGDQSVVGVMRDEYEKRRDYLCKALHRAGFRFPTPDGAFYTFFPVESGVFRRIIDKGVVIVPGTAFGVNAPEYARLSYAASMGQLERAVERIEEAVNGV